MLTDGVWRDATAINANGTGTQGVTVELSGAYQDNVITFELPQAADLSSVVIKNARGADAILAGLNRHTNLVSVSVSEDGNEFTECSFSVQKTVVAGAPTYSEDGGNTVHNQFHDITATLNRTAKNVSYVKIVVNTLKADGSSRGTIVHFDEVEAYGVYLD